MWVGQRCIRIPTTLKVASDSLSPSSAWLRLRCSQDTAEIPTGSCCSFFLVPLKKMLDSTTQRGKTSDRPPEHRSGRPLPQICFKKHVSRGNMQFGKIKLTSSKIIDSFQISLPCKKKWWRPRGVVFLKTKPRRRITSQALQEVIGLRLHRDASGLRELKPGRRRLKNPTDDHWLSIILGLVIIIIVNFMSFSHSDDGRDRLSYCENTIMSMDGPWKPWKACVVDLPQTSPNTMAGKIMKKWRTSFLMLVTVRWIT